MYKEVAIGFTVLASGYRFANDPQRRLDYLDEAFAIRSIHFSIFIPFQHYSSTFPLHKHIFPWSQAQSLLQLQKTSL